MPVSRYAKLEAFVTNRSLFAKLGGRDVYSMLRLEEAHRDHTTYALTLDALPHGMAVGVCGWLHEQREKSRQYGDILLRRLLQGLDDPASHVREKVIKALGGVLDCDVTLLGNAHVEAAVQVSVRVRAYSVVVVPWFRRLTSLPWLSGEEATHTTEEEENKKKKKGKQNTTEDKYTISNEHREN